MVQHWPFIRPSLRVHARLLVSALSLLLLVRTTNATDRSLGAESRVVGGQDVGSNDKYPFYAVVDSGGMLCGATLIWPDMLLTAAHCNIQVGTDVYMGSATDIQRPNFHTTVKHLTVHPNYSRYEGNKFDAVILRLEHQAPFPFVVVNGDENLPASGQELTILGHGYTDPEGKNGISKVLQEATVNYIEDCDSPEYVYNHPGYHYNQHVHICAGGGGRDTCDGDSGSPLLARKGGGQVMVGITSWGAKCASEVAPGVYTRISTIYAWILREICALSDLRSPDCDYVHHLIDPTQPPEVYRWSSLRSGTISGGTSSSLKKVEDKAAAKLEPTTTLSPTASPTATFQQQQRQWSYAGTIRIDMTADDYPEDISFSLTQINPISLEESLLYTLPYGAWDEASHGLPSITVVLEDMPLEASYRLRVDDFAGDGIAGGFGDGHLEVYQVDSLQHDVILETLVTSDGNYGAGFDITFQLTTSPP